MSTTHWHHCLPVGLSMSRLLWSITFSLLAVAGCRPEPSELTVQPSEVRVNRSQDGAKQYISVMLKNTGGQSLEIYGVRTACSCTVAQLPADRVLSPGDETTLVLSVSPPDYGEKTSFVMIDTSSAGQRNTPLKVTLIGAENEVPRIISQAERDRRLVGNGYYIRPIHYRNGT